MPIFFDGNSSGYESLACTNRLNGRLSAEFQEPAGRCITIGLINNMPDAALEATERQFLTLLSSASDGVMVRLSLYALPEVPRNEASQRHISRYYDSVENLWNSQLDGLIVTGREPRTPNMMNEPYWGSLTRTLDWANENTSSTVWSCLAAHAALLHADGIDRRKSDSKHFGVFECERLSDHQLMAGVPLHLRMPHSRWNGITEDELTACGYSVLTRTQGAGVDTFIKQRRSLFVFFQGHPEYESDTLLLEYRRDVRRYLKGETDTYPSMPRSYFNNDAADALTALREKAMSGRREEQLSDVAAAVGEKGIVNTWHETAARVYGNWLEYICAQKERRLRKSKIATIVRGCGVDSTLGLANALDVLPSPQAQS
jgi:homoserine O-succinyltransferase/O-acetyltransferase